MPFRTLCRPLLAGAVFSVLAASPGLATDGTPGVDLPDATAPIIASTGGSGSNGYAFEPDGGNGGDGGDVTAVVEDGYPGSGIVSITSTGGNGGSGAPSMPLDCGPLCESTPGRGGNGGDGGAVDLTLTGEATGNVTARSQGGMAGTGYNGQSPTAGTGGEVTLTIEATASVGGNVLAESIGAGGAPVSGDVTVTISGEVDGSVTAKSNGASGVAGTISVVLDGGVVGGTITAQTAGESSLSFKFDVSDRNEFDAATTALSGSGAHGTVTINGHGYAWSGFSTLVNLLTYVAPTDRVVVTVQSTSSPDSSSGDAPPSTPRAPQPPVQHAVVIGTIPLITGQPERARCSGSSSIRTVRQNDGSIVVIHHSRGADTLIGQLKDGAYLPAASNWSVQVSGSSIEVSDGGGAASSCTFG